MRGFSDASTPHQLVFESFGVPLRVCASSEDVLAQIETLLPLARTDGGSELTAHRLGIVSEDDLTFSVYNSTTCVSQGGDLELALVILEGQVCSYISLHAPGLAFVHAGVVGYAGRTIVIPGESFSGKTTLVAALARAGALYYSDEYAVLDADGCVRPFATGSGPLPVGGDPLPMGLVAMTDFSPGAAWLPATLTGAAAALEVLGYTPAMTTRPEEVMRMVTRALDRAVVLKGERGEADDVAPQLLERLTQPSAAAVGPSRAPRGG